MQILGTLANIGFLVSVTDTLRRFGLLDLRGALSDMGLLNL